MAVSGNSYPALGFDPCPGDPDGVTQLASKWQDAAMLMIEAALTLDQTDAEQGSWQGQAADAFRSALNTHRTVIGKLRASYENNANVLNSWARQLRGFQEQARALERHASQAQDEIRAGNFKQAHGVSLSPADKRTLNGYQCDFTTIQQQAQQLHQDYFQAAGAISREIDGILKLPSGKRGWYGNAADQQQETALLGAEEHRKSGAVPEDEAERLLWWGQLPAKLQQQLIQQEPQDIGNTNGMPATARDAANRVLLQRTWEHAQESGNSALIAKLAPLHDALTDPQNSLYDRNMFLLGFDANGYGRAIVSYGNPDTSANTAVYVPGTGSSLNGIAGDIGRAQTIYKTSAQQSPQHSTASMVWLGYTAPQWPTGPIVQVSADAGAPLLANYVNSLALTHQGSSHLTVIGHSYGTTVCGEAFSKYHMHADDAIFVGSPGLTVDHASDLHLDPSRVWSGRMQSDPVPPISLPLGQSNWGNDYSERYGTDPTSREFGGQVFQSGFGDPALGSHSDYWHSDEPSLANMTHIVTGHPEAVTRASNAERDGAFPTAIGLGSLDQLGGGVLEDAGDAVPEGYGAPLMHVGDAMNETGHGINAVFGAGDDLGHLNAHGAAEQLDDAAHDVKGAAEDARRVVMDPFTDW